MSKQLCPSLITPRFRKLFGAFCLLVLPLLFCSQVVSGQKTPTKHRPNVVRKTKIHLPATRGTAYYIDFTAETYTAVTPETIQKDANNIIPLDEDDLETFYRVIGQKGGTGKFERDFVRLRVQDGKKPPLFIDRQGVVISNKAQYILTPRAFVEVDHFLVSRIHNRH